MRLWFRRFLYQGREVSYSSILSTSISARRQALYTTRGLDLQRYVDLVEEKRALTREVAKIAVDYDVGWKEGDRIEEDGKREEKEGREAGGEDGVLGKATPKDVKPKGEEEAKAAVQRAER